MSTATAEEKAVWQLEQENQFLVEYLREFNGMGAGPKWSNMACTRLILWAFFGEDVPEHHLPWTPYEMDVINRFMEHVPEHLKDVMKPKVEECKEMVAIRAEKTARDNYLRSKQYTQTH